MSWKRSPAQKLSDIRGLCGRLHEREAEPQRFVAPRRDIPLSGPPFICCGAEVAEGRPRRAPVVDETGHLVGCRHDGCLGPDSGPQAPGERPQAVLAATDRWLRQSKRLAGAVAGLPRAPAPELPPGDFMLGGEPQPGTEGLGLGPLPQLQADCREHGVHRAGVHTRDGHHVHPRQLIQPAAGVIAGGMLMVGADAAAIATGLLAWTLSLRYSARTHSPCFWHRFWRRVSGS